MSEESKKPSIHVIAINKVKQKLKDGHGLTNAEGQFMAREVAQMARVSRELYEIVDLHIVNIKEQAIMSECALQLTKKAKDSLLEMFEMVNKSNDKSELFRDLRSRIAAAENN